jgi:hypothetical protein
MTAALCRLPPVHGHDALRDRWIRWIVGRRLFVLGVALVATVVSVVLALGLEVDPDLRRLLPPGDPTVQRLEELERTFGATGSVNVVVAGGPPEARHAFADALAARLADHPMLAAVDHRLPSEFFAERALYYLSAVEMAQLQERVAAWTHYEVCTAAPDVCVDAPDAAAPDRLRAFIDAKRDESWRRTGFRDYYERDGIDALVLLLRPNRPSSDLEFATDVTAAMRREVGELAEQSDAPWAGAGLRCNLVGPYVVKADGHATIQRDMLRSGLAALVGVVAVLYVLFRSVRAVLVLLVPLACGVAWSLAFAQLTLGHLNSMTSLISTVLVGIGIDAGIHFLGRIRRVPPQVADGEAIRAAFHELLVPLLVASFTTVGAFAVMATSEFPAFREFGILSAAGVMLCLLAMVTVFPALAAAAGVKRPERRAEASWLGGATSAVLARPPLTFAVVVVLLLGSVSGLRRVAFEYDGRRLQSDVARAHTEADTHLISEIFGKDVHAGVLVTRDLDQTREILRTARERHEARRHAGTSVVASLFGAPDVLPPADVDPAVRAQEIADLAEEVPDRVWDDDPEQHPNDGHERLSAQDRGRLRRMLDARPVAFEDLPAPIRAKVRAPDGHFGVFAYPAFDAANIRRGVEFTAETSAYLDDPEAGIFVGETTIYAAMFTMLRDEAPIVLAMATLLIAAMVFWQVRSASQTLVTLIPLGVAMLWLVGAMGLIGVKFTLFNFPILPAILGIGVDNAVYLADRMRRSQGQPDGLARSLQETGGAILAATATTAVGFAAFLVADSGGLRSIGAVAMIGICMTAAAALLVLPTLGALAARRRSRARRRRHRAE